MLVGGTYSQGHVKFVSYDGAYPNLCRGILTLRIDGKEYKFGYGFNRPKEEIPQFKPFWESGGSCGFRNDWIESYVNAGEWVINVDELPEQFRVYATEIDEVFNENVPFGCCGGCL